MNKTTFHIPKMDCLTEEQLIQMKLDDDKSIRKLIFDLPGGKLVVYHEQSADSIQEKLHVLNLGAMLVHSVQEDLPEEVSLSTDSERRLLWTVLYINLGSFLLEIITGYIARSLGLIADSFDMLVDAVVYAMSLYVVGKAVSSKKRIAGISGYLELGLAVFGIVEVIRRFLSDQEPPNFQLMIIISFIALAGNAATLYLLQKAKSNDAHMKASVVFTSNDVIVNLGVIAAGVLVYFTESKIPDLVIGAIVFFTVGRGALQILKISK